MTQFYNDLSVLIVNFNGGALLTQCIQAVLASPLALEVIVSDNGSTDSSLADLEICLGREERLRILRNHANLGFAAGHNRVLPLAQAPYLLFLNPDCLVEPNTLPRMLDFMERHPEVGMAGAIIRNPDGTEQRACRRRLPDPWVGLVRFLHLEGRWPGLVAAKRLNLQNDPLPSAPQAVEAISGSLMLVRREALDRVGPLDEGYFLHCEDLDWFMRFRQAGIPIYLIPGAEARHHQGACSADRPIRVEWHKHQGMVRFFRKFQFRDYPLPFSWLVLIGIWAHFGAFVLLQGARRLARQVTQAR
jgi:GT2 family glycosyltransferase